MQWLAALSITTIALLVLLNGTFFSSYSAPHIDFSINFSAAHALRDGNNPYGTTTLYDYAVEVGSQTELIYSQLYTSYIQPPTSALSIMPLTLLSWRDASRVYLVLNHVLLFAAVALTLCTVRPSLPLPWAIAGASVVVAFYSQLNGSFSLGQVDATLLLLFALGFWAFCRNRPAIAGSAIAIAAAIKLVPALLLLYFLWKRDYRAFAWGAGVGLALFLASLAAVGPGIYETYVTETLPALAKGSTHYSNASFGGLIARLSTPDVIKVLPDIYYLDEVPSGATARLASLAVTLGAIVALALLIPRGRVASAASTGSAPDEAPRRDPYRLVFEYYLVVAVTIMVSSVAWEFYSVWLIPVFLAAFLAPDRVLPGRPWRWAALVLLALVYVGLNYPGDFFIFDRNGFFYHPEWVTGVWVEERVRLYHNHLDAILILRLSSLLLLGCILGALIFWNRVRRGLVADDDSVPASRE
ncbi:MAG TPA: glycosyltransferase family 87 protein [Dehalococcoidia bacterium]|nr:glycosyltransferase family 87 protein [Dehalococcoidia bacterium]